MDEAYQNRLLGLNSGICPIHGPYQHDNVKDPDPTMEKRMVESKEDEVLNNLYHGDLSDFDDGKEYTPTNEEK